MPRSRSYIPNTACFVVPRPFLVPCFRIDHRRFRHCGPTYVSSTSTIPEKEMGTSAAIARRTMRAILMTTGCEMCVCWQTERTVRYRKNATRNLLHSFVPPRTPRTNERKGVHSFRHLMHFRLLLRTLHDRTLAQRGHRGRDILVEKYLLSPTMSLLWLNENKNPPFLVEECLVYPFLYQIQHWAYRTRMSFMDSDRIWGGERVHGVGMTQFGDGYA